MTRWATSLALQLPWNVINRDPKSMNILGVGTPAYRREGKE